MRLLVPVIPPTFYAAGINYREHVIEGARKRGQCEESSFHASFLHDASAGVAAANRGEGAMPSERHRNQVPQMFEDRIGAAMRERQ